MPRLAGSFFGGVGAGVGGGVRAGAGAGPSWPGPWTPAAGAAAFAGTQGARAHPRRGLSTPRRPPPPAPALTIHNGQRRWNEGCGARFAWRGTCVGSRSCPRPDGRPGPRRPGRRLPGGGAARHRPRDPRPRRPARVRGGGAAAPGQARRGRRPNQGFGHLLPGPRVAHGLVKLVLPASHPYLTYSGPPVIRSLFSTG